MEIPAKRLEETGPTANVPPTERVSVPRFNDFPDTKLVVVRLLLPGPTSVLPKDWLAARLATLVNVQLSVMYKLGSEPAVPRAEAGIASVPPLRLMTPVKLVPLLPFSVTAPVPSL